MTCDTPHTHLLEPAAREGCVRTCGVGWPDLRCVSRAPTATLHDHVPELHPGYDDLTLSLGRTLACAQPMYNQPHGAPRFSDLLCPRGSSVTCSIWCYAPDRRTCAPAPLTRVSTRARPSLLLTPDRIPLTSLAPSCRDDPPDLSWLQSPPVGPCGLQPRTGLVPRPHVLPRIEHLIQTLTAATPTAPRHPHGIRW